MRRPQESPARLNFKPGVIVVLEFRAKVSRKRIFNHRDFILHKGVENPGHTIGWKKSQREIAPRNIAGSYSDSRSPRSMFLLRAKRMAKLQLGRRASGHFL